MECVKAFACKGEEPFLVLFLWGNINNENNKKNLGTGSSAMIADPRATNHRKIITSDSVSVLLYN